MNQGINPRFEQNIMTDAIGINADRAFLAHLSWSATEAAATSNTGILAGENLGSVAKTVSAGFTAPAVARNLRVGANVSGVTGTVAITGENWAGEAITESFTLNGTSFDEGDKAFARVISATLPVQVHTPVAQVETATAAGTVTTAGNAAVTITAAGATWSPKTIDVPVELGDDAAAIALAIRTALAADEDVATLFTVSGDAAALILTKKAPAANDSTLNIAIADGSEEGASEGVTTAATSTNTAAGVPYDIISIGWGDKLGLPFKLAHNTVQEAYLNHVREANAPGVTVSATALESNTIDLHSALDGSAVDVYLFI